jgi:hypothetical protein
MRSYMTQTAGRAAEEILYGQDEMSTINQRQLTLARRIAQKLVVSGGLSDARGLGPSPITHPVPMGGTLGQIVPQRVSDFMTCPRSEAGRRAHQRVCLRSQRPADTDMVAGTGGAQKHESTAK